LQRVLTRMHKRSVMRSGGISTWLVGASGWMGARGGS
jgi:hypothetical protein